MIRKHILFTAAAMLTAATATATPSTFRISQIYSNLDGTVQYVELTESAGLDGQHRLAGLRLTSTAATAVVRQYVFPNDLPSEKTANMSIVVAAFDVSIPVTDTDELGFNCCYQPEFRMPSRFISIGRAKIDFAGVDSVSYEALPTDGAFALHRNGSVTFGTLPANGRCYQGTACTNRYRVEYRAMPIVAVEYFNASLDHYLHTAFSDEIDILDGAGSAWTRTANDFRVYATGTDDVRVDEVCRFYIPPHLGDSHFMSVSPEECAEVKIRFPEFTFEAPRVFTAGMPHPVSGECPRYFGSSLRMAPVYRLWNQRKDSNHRYTTSVTMRGEMIRRGYSSEGYGPLGVAMCAAY